MSPFLFAMYLNDLEAELYLKGSDGIGIVMLKIFLLLYADDITIFARSAEELQNNLDRFHEYSIRYRLIVNTSKTKVMVFRRGGILPRNTKFYYNNFELAIVNTFSYLGIVFLTSGSFRNARKLFQGKRRKLSFNLIVIYIISQILHLNVNLSYLTNLLHPF